MEGCFVPPLFFLKQFKIKQMQQGKIKFYDPIIGLGIIEGVGQDDIFFHIKSLSNKGLIPAKGDQVMFDIVEDLINESRIRADRIEIITDFKSS